MLAVPDNVHREDAVFIEAAEIAEGNHGVVGSGTHARERTIEIHICDVAEIPAGVLASRGKINADEIIEDERLRRLREARTAVGQPMVVRVVWVLERIGKIR